MELNKDYTKILGTDNANTIDDTNSTQIDEIEADMTTIEESVTTLETNNTGTNTGDNSANTTYADDYRTANFVADTDYQSVPSEGAFEDGDKSKLDGIEESADVTDAANVNAVESDPIVGAVTGIVKADGAGAISSASAGTDYQAPLTADTDYLTPGTAGTTYEPLKGDDDNYVTDAEKTVIGNTSGSNSGDNAVNTNYSSLTQYTDEMAQDAVGGMVDGSLTYTDGTPELKVTNPVSAEVTGFTISAGTTPKTLTVADTASVTGSNTGDQSASDFNHDDLANITGTASQYNHPTDAQMTVLGNTSNTNTGDQTIDDITPTTTKGDIIVEDGSNAVRLAAGSNTQVLTANSSTATGLEWSAPGTPGAHASSHEDGGADEISVATAIIEDGAVTSRKAALTVGQVVCSTNTTISSDTETDITGATVNITPAVPSTMVVNAVFDMDGTVAGDLFEGLLDVDGTNEDGNAEYQTPVSNDSRFTVSQTWSFNLTAASHTIKLQAKRTVGSGNSNVRATNTKFTYILVSQ